MFYITFPVGLGVSESDMVSIMANLRRGVKGVFFWFVKGLVKELTCRGDRGTASEPGAFSPDRSASLFLFEEAGGREVFGGSSEIGVLRASIDPPTEKKNNGNKSRWRTPGGRIA